MPDRANSLPSGAHHTDESPGRRPGSRSGTKPSINRWPGPSTEIRLSGLAVGRILGDAPLPAAALLDLGRPAEQGREVMTPRLVPRTLAFSALAALALLLTALVVPAAAASPGGVSGGVQTLADHIDPADCDPLTPLSVEGE